jgi:DNA-binding transcriptional regulator YiaG
MKRKYQDKEIEKAQNLRHKYHYSFVKLAQITGIPATTLRNWCKNDQMGTRWDTLLTTNERRRKKIKSSEIKSITKLKPLDINTRKLLVSIIYWCEGSKYPATNKVDLTNSDPLLLQIFIKFLRESFPLDESKFRAKLQIHSTQDFSEIKKYWSKLLDIPISQFMKPTITVANGKKHRKDYMGTCTIRYSDYKIQLKLIGIYEQFGKLIN